MLLREIIVGKNQESYSLPLSTVSVPAAKEDLTRANPQRDQQDGQLKTPEAVLSFTLSLDCYYPGVWATLNRQIKNPKQNISIAYCVFSMS